MAEDLIRNIGDNDFQTVKLLVHSGIDLDVQETEQNMTALMVAIENESFEIARLLIEHGVNLDLVDKDTNTALILAAKSNESEALPIIKMLIQKNDNINFQNHDGQTALMVASKSGNLEIAKLLIEKGANLDLKDSNGCTALSHACLNAKIELVHFLIKKGANVNTQDNEGDTPLMISVDRNFFIISEMLIDNNADLHICNRNGESIWFHLCKFNAFRFKKFSFQARCVCNDSRRYSHFWRNEDFTITELLWYFRNYNRNYSMVNGFLDLCGEYGNDHYTRMTNMEMKFDTFLVECHKRCLEKVAKKSDWFDKPNKEGKTPLFKAVCLNADKWIVDLLRNKGANVLHNNNQGETMLCYAMENNFDEIVEILIQNGAKLHFKSQRKGFIDKMSNELFGSKASILKAYRNALIKELSDLFKYTDYEAFKKRVIESIQNEEAIVVEYNHFKALSLLLPQDKKELEEAITHLKSSQFRERLIVDYLNVLDDQKKLLDMSMNKMTQSFPELTKPQQQYNFGQSKGNRFAQNKLNDKLFDIHLISELVSEEALGGLIDFVKEQSTSETRVKELTKIMESINKYNKVVSEKISVGRDLLKLVESI